MLSLAARGPQSGQRERRRRLPESRPGPGASRSLSHPPNRPVSSGDRRRKWKTAAEADLRAIEGADEPGGTEMSLVKVHAQLLVHLPFEGIERVRLPAVLLPLHVAGNDVVGRGGVSRHGSSSR